MTDAPKLLDADASVLIAKLKARRRVEFGNDGVMNQVPDEECILAAVRLEMLETALRNAVRIIKGMVDESEGQTLQ